MSFRVVTFNIQNGESFDDTTCAPPSIDLDRTCQFIKSLAPDIFCLQEVERGWDGGRQVEPPPNYIRLKEVFPNYDSVFSYPIPNDKEIPFGLGLAIFSKTSLRDFEKVHLPAANLEFEFEGKTRQASSRLLIEASTTIEGRDVRLMNTHLQAFFMIAGSSDSHPEQRNIIEERLKLYSGRAAILTGDMNSAPGETIVRQFEDSGYQAAQNSEVTWRRRPYITDHIFYNSNLELKSGRVVQTQVSDHHAVVADFDFH